MRFIAKILRATKDLFASTQMDDLPLEQYAESHQPGEVRIGRVMPVGKCESGTRFLGLHAIPE